MNWMRTAGLGVVTATLAVTGTTLLLAREAVDPPRLDVSADTDLTLRFTKRVKTKGLNLDSIRVRDAEGASALGDLVRGEPLVDAETGRRVVIRPEAVREYFQFVKQLDRQQARRKAERLIRRVERSGRLRLLDRLDRRLGEHLDLAGHSALRLDDPDVDATFPATAVPELRPLDDPHTRLLTYRRAIAGHDDLWRNHLDGDFTAFPELAANPDYERFFHPIDPETSVPSANSVLRDREHRRMLVRRSARRVTFLPRLPVRADLSDAGLVPGAEYALDVQRPLRGARRLLSALGGAARLARDGRATLSVSSDTPLAGAGPASLPVAPRVVNVTPPDGEELVPVATDWEDPDDHNVVAPSAGSRFVVRLRFADALDPRTVHEGSFRLARVARDVGTPDETVVFEPVECEVRLVQSRLGQVRVELLPVLGALDGGSRYELRVGMTVRALDGAFLRDPFRSEFTTH